MAKFLLERRKNFPTKERIEARKAAERERKAENDDSALIRERDKLRKQLAKVESSIKRKREPGDEGDEMRDLTLDDSDDDKPEVMSSKTAPSGTKSSGPPPPPTKKADITRHCKYFSTGGTCGKKGKCRFVHDPQVRDAALKEREANHGRLTIQQRLVLNDKDQEDLAVLHSIQYLRDKGVMANIEAPAGAGDAAAGKKPETESAPVPVAAPAPSPKPNPSLPAPPPAPKTSLLPAAPPSLPQPPHKREQAAQPQPPAEQPPPSTEAPAGDSVDDGAVVKTEEA